MKWSIVKGPPSKAHYFHRHLRARLHLLSRFSVRFFYSFIHWLLSSFVFVSLCIFLVFFVDSSPVIESSSKFVSLTFEKCAVQFPKVPNRLLLSSISHFLIWFIDLSVSLIWFGFSFCCCCCCCCCCWNVRISLSFESVGVSFTEELRLRQRLRGLALLIIIATILCLLSLFYYFFSLFSLELTRYKRKKDGNEED